MAFFSQLRLLLWKNLLLQRRKVIISIFEVILPLVFAAIVVTTRTQTKPEKIAEPTIYNATNPAGYQIVRFIRNLGSITEVGVTPDTPLTREFMDQVLDKFILYLSPLLPKVPYENGRPPRVFPIKFTNHTYR